MAATSRPQGSSFRKCRSQDTVEGRNEDPGQGPGQEVQKKVENKVQDKIQDKDKDKFEEASKVADGLGVEAQRSFSVLQRMKQGKVRPQRIPESFAFKTPDRHEKKNTDSVIQYIYTLEAAAQAIVPEFPRLETSTPLTRSLPTKSAMMGCSRTRVKPSAMQARVVAAKRPTGQEHLGCDWQPC